MFDKDLEDWPEEAKTAMKNLFATNPDMEITFGMDQANLTIRLMSLVRHLYKLAFEFHKKQGTMPKPSGGNQQGPDGKKDLIERIMEGEKNVRGMLGDLDIDLSYGPRHIATIKAIMH